MNKYTRLTKQERILIEIGIRSRLSMRAIARSIGRPSKSVFYEIKKNGDYLGYYAVDAHFKGTKFYKRGYSKINSHPELAYYIRDKIAQKWSPEVIAGKWNKEHKSLKITHESIYRWIYNQKDGLYLKLALSKGRRGRRPQRNKSKILNRISVHQRPEFINNRSEVGHYEADLVFQQGNGSQNILTVMERKSRKMILIKNESKHSEVVIGALNEVKIKSKYPIKTVTFDNGTEFAKHSILNIDTYFCDPASPWQKGSIENGNKILRNYLDYRINPTYVTQEYLDLIADMINNRPRKILGFLTPNEMLDNLYKEKIPSVTFYN